MQVTSRNGASQSQLAVFLDFENLALGFRSGDESFDVRLVLDRLLEKGKVISKVAYADWHRFREYTGRLHEHGFELIEIPRRGASGKNSADIRLCVDALDLSWSKEHIDTFAIVSGDSDFSPLVAKLKENGRRVIGLGMRASTSPLLANACDEFIYYEELAGTHAAPVRARGSDDGMTLLADTVRALQREGVESIQASLVKDTMKRKRPAFSETALGYGSFSEMLEDAQEKGLVALRRDDRSGTYAVTAAGRAPASASGRAPASPSGAPSARRRGRRADALPRREPAGRSREPLGPAKAEPVTSPADVGGLSPSVEPRGDVGARRPRAASGLRRRRSRRP